MGPMRAVESRMRLRQTLRRREREGGKLWLGREVWWRLERSRLYQRVGSEEMMYHWIDIRTELGNLHGKIDRPPNTQKKDLLHGILLYNRPDHCGPSRRIY